MGKQTTSHLVSLRSNNKLRVVHTGIINCEKKSKRNRQENAVRIPGYTTQ
jgi:hypothetical protein